MVGYNFVNPSATELILPATRSKRLGVMCMYAVRGALAHADSLRILILTATLRSTSSSATASPNR